MTKEELIAEEHICNGKCQDDITKNYVHCKTCTRLKDFLAGYKAGKSELEAQIEKMKCCFNCKHSRTEYEHCRTDKHEKWEIKEND